jgi:hypothetical protein
MMNIATDAYSKNNNNNNNNTNIYKFLSLKQDYCAESLMETNECRLLTPYENIYYNLC